MRRLKSRIRSSRFHILAGLTVGTWLTVTTALVAQPPSEEPPGGAGYGAGRVGEASFHIDPETGSLIVVTDDATDQYIQTILESLDRPVPQVLIKVLFLEVTHGDDLDLGVEASYQHGRRKVISDLETAVTDTRSVVDGTVSSEYTETTQYTKTQGIEHTLESIFGLAALHEAGLDGGYYRLIKEDLDMTIRALAQVGKLEVLSRPSILARNNESAIITLGQEVPFITNSRVTQDGQIINTVEYQDVGIILEVTPHISPDGLVEMLVAPEISTLSGETVTVTQGVEVPIIAKRAAETSVVVPDGMTVVIGGLMEDNETELVRKVPILGDIPWIGTVFRRTIKSKAKTELLIFLTPHVVQRTGQLETLSIAESRKSQLAPVAFTENELDQHLDNQAKLIAKPKEAGAKPRVGKRFASWVRSVVRMLK